MFNPWLSFRQHGQTSLYVNYYATENGVCVCVCVTSTVHTRSCWIKENVRASAGDGSPKGETESQTGDGLLKTAPTAFIGFIGYWSAANFGWSGPARPAALNLAQFGRSDLARVEQNLTPGSIKWNRAPSTRDVLLSKHEQQLHGNANWAIWRRGRLAGFYNTDSTTGLGVTNVSKRTDALHKA